MEIKQIGKNGQISLGKQYEGRLVMVEEIETGVWSIKTATAISDQELRQQNPLGNLDAALQNRQAAPPVMQEKVAQTATPVVVPDVANLA
jgi:hypothetical protein